MGGRTEGEERRMRGKREKEKRGGEGGERGQAKGEKETTSF